MKKVALQLSLLMFSAVLTFSQTVTQADREKGEQYLQQTREGVVAARKGLSEAQMKFKPGLDRWSVAQVLENITLVEDGLFLNVTETEKVMKSAARAADRDTAKIDAQVLAMLPDRSTKRQSAPPFMPTGRWTPAETLDHFLKGRAQTMALPESAPDLRAHVGDRPARTARRLRMATVYGRARRAAYQTNPRSESGSEFPEELMMQCAPAI